MDALQNEKPLCFLHTIELAVGDFPFDFLFYRSEENVILAEASDLMELAVTAGGLPLLRGAAQRSSLREKYKQYADRAEYRKKENRQSCIVCNRGAKRTTARISQNKIHACMLFHDLPRCFLHGADIQRRFNNILHIFLLGYGLCVSSAASVIGNCAVMAFSASTKLGYQPPSTRNRHSL